MNLQIISLQTGSGKLYGEVIVRFGNIHCRIQAPLHIFSQKTIQKIISPETPRGRDITSASFENR